MLLTMRVLLKLLSEAYLLSFSSQLVQYLHGCDRYHYVDGVSSIFTNVFSPSKWAQEFSFLHLSGFEVLILQINSTEKLMQVANHVRPVTEHRAVGTAQRISFGVRQLSSEVPQHSHHQHKCSHHAPVAFFPFFASLSLSLSRNFSSRISFNGLLRYVLWMHVQG